jgi:hypothetical protein
MDDTATYTIQGELFDSDADAALAFPMTLEGCVVQLDVVGALVDALESQLKDARARQRYLSEHLLAEVVPDDVVWEKNVATVELSMLRRTVKLRREFHASVTKELREEAHQYLDANGYGNLLKHEVCVSFPRDNRDAAVEAMMLVERDLGHVKGMSTIMRTELAGATMLAWVKARLRAGHPVPECFSVYAPVRVVHDDVVQRDTDEV